MSNSANLPKMYPVVMTTAIPGSSHPKKIAVRTRSELSGGYLSMKDKNPLYYNSLVGKHTSKYMQKADVKKHLHQMGFCAVDGTVYPTRQEQIEANHVNHLLEGGQAMPNYPKLNMCEQSCLHQLGEAARTKSSLCENCYVYRKVASKLNITSSCPSSYLSRRQVEQRKQENDIPKCLLQTRLSHQQETVSMQPPLVETGHIFTQTSSKDYSAGSTQTSTRQLPHRTTQTSQRVSPDIGVQTSLVAQPVHVGVVQKSSLKRSWHESSNDRSSTEFVSPSSYHNNNDSAVTTGLQRQNTVLKKHVREQMLVQEKDTLKEHMQMDCNIGKTFTKTLMRHQVEAAKRELTDNCKIALVSILETLRDEQEKFHSTIEKEKAAKRLRKEQRKMDKLIAEQIKFEIKNKLDKELEEKRQVLTATNIELAEIVEAKKRAETALVETRSALARSLKEPKKPKVITPVPVSSLPSVSLEQTSESTMQTCTLDEPDQPDEEMCYTKCTKQDIVHAAGLLEKIKADLCHLFPRQSNYIHWRTSVQAPRIPSKKSQVDRLQSISNNLPVSFTAAPIPKVEGDLQPKRSVARHSSRISQSTLSTISQMWAAAVKEAEAEVVTEHASVEVASEQPSIIVPENFLEPEVVPTEKSTSLGLISRKDMIERKASSQLSVETAVTSDKPSTDIFPHQKRISDASVQSILTSSNTHETAYLSGMDKCTSTSTLGIMQSTLHKSESLSLDTTTSSIEPVDNVEESKYLSAITHKCHGEFGSELNTEHASEDEADVAEQLSSIEKAECASEPDFLPSAHVEPIASKNDMTLSVVRLPEVTEPNQNSIDLVIKSGEPCPVDLTEPEQDAKLELRSDDIAVEPETVLEMYLEGTVASTSTKQSQSESTTSIEKSSNTSFKDSSSELSSPKSDSASKLSTEIIERGNSTSLDEPVSKVQTSSMESVSKDSTRSSKKGSTASLKEALATRVTNEDDSTQQSASKVSLKKESAAPLKDALTTSVVSGDKSILNQQIASEVSTRSSQKGSTPSLKQAQATSVENGDESIQQSGGSVSAELSLAEAAAIIKLHVELVREMYVKATTSTSSTKSMRRRLAAFDQKLSLAFDMDSIFETSPPDAMVEKSTSKLSTSLEVTPSVSEARTINTESFSKVTSRSSKKERSTAPPTVVATGDDSIQQCASKVSERSLKESTASLEGFVATGNESIQESPRKVLTSTTLSRRVSKTSIETTSLKDSKSEMPPPDVVVDIIVSKLSAEIIERDNSASHDETSPVSKVQTSSTESVSKVSTRSSKKGSTASLKEAPITPVATGDVSIQHYTSNVSLKKESAALLKEAHTTSVVNRDVSIQHGTSKVSLKKESAKGGPAHTTSEPSGDKSGQEIASKVSTRSSQKGSTASLKQAQTTSVENGDESIQQNGGSVTAELSLAETGATELHSSESKLANEMYADASTSTSSTKEVRRGLAVSIQKLSLSFYNDSKSETSPPDAMVEKSKLSTFLEETPSVSEARTAITESVSQVSTTSSEKGSTASLKKFQATPVATGDDSIQQCASKVSERYSKEYTPSLEEGPIATLSRRESKTSIEKLSTTSLEDSKFEMPTPDVVVDIIASKLSTKIIERDNFASRDETLPVSNNIQTSVTESVSNVSTRSSKKRSTSSLKEAPTSPVATGDNKNIILKSASKLSTSLSDNGSTASPKEDPVTTGVNPKRASKVSTRSSKKGATAALKKTPAMPVATGDCNIPMSASKKSSKQGPPASLNKGPTTPPVAVEHLSKNSTINLIQDAGISSQTDMSQASKKSEVSLKSLMVGGSISQKRVKVIRRRSCVKKLAIPLAASPAVASMSKTSAKSSKLLLNPESEVTVIQQKQEAWEVVTNKRSSWKSLKSASKTSLKSQTSEVVTPTKGSSTPALLDYPLSATVSYADIIKKNSNTKVVPTRKSKMRVIPSDVSDMKSQTPIDSGMTLGDAITTIKSQSGSKKSLMSLRSSLKSLLLPSQQKNSKFSQASTSGTSGVSQTSPVKGIHILV